MPFGFKKAQKLNKIKIYFPKLLALTTFVFTYWEM